MNMIKMHNRYAGSGRRC